MANDWREVLLEDVADEITVGFVGSMSSEYVEKGIPFLRSLNIEPLRINKNDLKFISEEFHKRIHKSRLSPGDVVIVRTGKPGACSIIPEWLSDANCSDIVIVRCGKNIDNRFLAYYVNTVTSSYVAAHLVGAVQQHFNVGSARKIKIKLPPLVEQRAIAHILGTLDDKIELNCKMNETLETIAQTIFKSWFIDFDPVKAKAEGRKPDGMSDEIAALFPENFDDSELGKTPSGWNIGKLSDIVNMAESTINPSKFPDEVFNLYSIPAFDSGAMPSRNFGNTIKSNKSILPNGAILISKLNPVTPRVWQIFEDFPGRSIASTEFVAFLPKQSNVHSFLYCILKSESYRNKMIEAATGTSGSHQRIKKEYLLNLNIILPSLPLLSLFHSTATQLIKLILGNILENRQLSDIRDTLLPKLITGEIRIKDAEKFVSEII